MKGHEQALLFLKKAAEDEVLLDEVLTSPRVTDTTIGFHCQQAAEKPLKALLSELAVNVRRTHDLIELLDLLEDAGEPLPPALREVENLNPYAVIFRYEDDASAASLDRARARQLIRELRALVESRVGS
jgi:HEPN domain-containing protein